jgi:hypothetical protein
MAFATMFAAILAVVAAAKEPERDLAPAGDAVQTADVADAAEPADPAEAEPPADASPAATVAAPEGDALANSPPILIDRIEDADGWAVERLLEPSGAIVEHAVNRAGTVQTCRKVGSLFTLRVIDQQPAHGGEVVEVVRDATGALLRLAIGRDGEPRAVALVAPPPR